MLSQLLKGEREDWGLNIGLGPWGPRPAAVGPQRAGCWEGPPELCRWRQQGAQGVAVRRKWVPTS